MEFNQNKELLSNTLALNVALQTIKERCVHLQKRLYALESENSRLRLNNVNSDNESRNVTDNSLVSELENMRAKNAELTLQNSQLTENLSMISTENRKLWRRLSHLTKENGDNEADKGSEELLEPVAKQHANLIRSKTFTQNSPHQLLKEKLVGSQIGPADDDELEDISLINDCGFSAADKMVDGVESESCDVDTKSCTDGLMSIKKEVLRQNNELKVAISNWRKNKNSVVASEVCSCKSKTNDLSKKPMMVDKSLETDRDLTLDFEMDQDAPNNNLDMKHETILDDLREQKKAADMADKICPMCGKFYTQNILFEEFQEHVESHFRDSDSDIEQLSLDHNFELVSHSVGNF